MMAINFKSLIHSFVWGDISITRYGIGSWANGRYTDGATSSVTITGALFPTMGEQAEANQLMRLLEGQRTKDAILVFTYDPMYTAEAPNGRKADIVTYNGEEYEATKIRMWDADLYEVTLVKVDQ